MGHTNNVCDSAHSGDNTSQRIGIFFTKLLEQYEAELAQQLVLATLLDDDGETGGEIGGLLTNLGALVVEAPEDSRHDLRKVGLDADAYGKVG